MSWSPEQELLKCRCSGVPHAECGELASQPCHLGFQNAEGPGTGRLFFFLTPSKHLVSPG